MTPTICMPMRRRAPALMATLAALAIGIAAVGATARPAHATHTTTSCDETADFSLSANLKPPNFIGHLTRGPSSAPQPAYFVNSFGGFFMSNTIVAFSEDGAGCEIAVDVLDLPAGVTSQMPATITVRSTGVGTTELALQAAGGAALGDATVTVRATLGDQVRTLDLPITIEDEPDVVLPVSTVSDDIDAGLLITTAEEDTVVQLSSSDPGVAQVPESVTIRAGSSSASFHIDVQSETSKKGKKNKDPKTVTITATLGDLSDSVVLTVQPQ